MNVDGFTNYFKDNYNKLDMLYFGCNIIYVILRIGSECKEIVPTV